MMRTTDLLCRASLIASAFAGLSTPALAQEEGASEADDAIIVTARRREENLVDVPIAITSLSADQLERTGAIDITAVAEQAPNVTLEASRATNSTLTAFIRGVGQQDPVSGFVRTAVRRRSSLRHRRTMHIHAYTPVKIRWG